MLNEPHYPSKWTAAIVFFLIILMIVGVFVWAFWLNMGTIVVKSDLEFSLDVNGENRSCAQRICEFKLAPREYSFVARSDGYYDDVFNLSVARWEKVEKIIDFELIPYLRDIKAEELPKEETEVSNPEVLGLFESLKEPDLMISGNTAIVLDQGRIFFVDMETKRKLRRFDDTVLVEDARLSDNGKKVLLFVEMEAENRLWLWMNETDELLTFDWYEEAQFIQWAPNEDHVIYIVTDKLSDNSQETMIELAAGAMDEGKTPLALFKYNLDTDEAKMIKEFDGETPTVLMRRGGRYIIEFGVNKYQELVVK